MVDWEVECRVFWKCLRRSVLVEAVAPGKDAMGSIQVLTSKSGPGLRLWRSEKSVRIGIGFVQGLLVMVEVVGAIASSR